MRGAPAPAVVAALVEGCDATEALARLRAALAEHATDIALRIAVAQALRQRAPETALALLREAPPGHARDADLGLECVALLRALKRGGEASALLVDLAGRHPEDGRIAAQRAGLMEAAGDHAGAAEAFAIACRASPGDTQLRIRFARSLRAARRPAEAVTALENLPADLPQATAERSYALLAVGDVARAGEEIAALARRHPGFPHLPRLTALRAEALGDMPEAAAALARAMAIEPTHAGLRDQRRRALRLAGDADGLRALLAEAPAGRDAIRGDLVEALLEQGQVRAAEAVLDTLPADGDLALRGAVLVALRRGRHALAASHAAAILARRPDDAWALWRQAQALALSFRAEAAWSRLRRLEASGALSRRTARNNAVGHLVNDMRLNPATTAMLALAEEGMPGRALAVAVEMMRQEPGETAPALALLRHWPAPDAGDDKGGVRLIPPCLHGAEETGPAAAFLASRLDAAHPAMAVEAWPTRGLMAEAASTMPLLAQALRLAPAGAVVRDLLRLGVLVLRGGVWVDPGLLCIAPLDPLLPPGAGLVLARDGLGGIGTAFLAASPGHAALRAALEEACQEVIGGARESAWLTTGGGLLARHVARWLAETGGARGVVIHDPGRIGRHLRPTRHSPWQPAIAGWEAEM